MAFIARATAAEVKRRCVTLSLILLSALRLFLLRMKRSFLRLQVFNRCFNSIKRKPVADCRAEFPITLNFFIDLGAFMAHRTPARTAKRSNPHWSPSYKDDWWWKLFNRRFRTIQLIR
jgi:hypothetical protein